MIQRFSSGGPYEQRIGYSRVVRAGDLFVTAGCTSVVDGVLMHHDDPYAQSLTAFSIGVDALAAAGCPIENVVQTRMYITKREHAEDVGRAHKAIFAEINPAATMVVVAGLIDPHMLVEVELVGRCGAGRA